jgi:prepilin-type N-terminal cleavage/methylation domain-containing protein
MQCQVFFLTCKIYICICVLLILFLVMKNISSKSLGMTLVELSIVLAILGILIVATISGKSLIDMARATATIRYFKDRSVAMQLFDASYSSTPGDAKSSDIVDLSPVVFGDGTYGINTFQETLGVDYHFSLAKLYAKTIPASALTAGVAPASGTVNTPALVLSQSKISGAYVFTASTSSIDHFHAIAVFNSSTPTGYSPIASPTFKIIDTKTDDGVSNSGFVQCYPGIGFSSSASAVLGVALSNYNSACILGASASM